MMNRKTVLFSIILLSLNLSTAFSQQDTLKPKTKKNRFSVELLGDPFAIYLERRVINTDSYQLYAGVGVNLLLSIMDETNVSVSLNNSFRISPQLSIFGLMRAQLGCLAFPQIPFNPVPGSGYVPGRNHLGINYVSLNFGVGPSFNKGRWEFAPLYPAYNYSQGSFAGEDTKVAWYSSISLNSRIYYHF